MLSPRRGPPGRAHSGRLASRVAPGPVFHPDVDDGAERVKIRVIKTALKLGALALVVFLLVSIQPIIQIHVNISVIIAKQKSLYYKAISN